MIKTSGEVESVSETLESEKPGKFESHCVSFPNNIAHFFTDNVKMVWVGASDTGRTNGDFRWTDRTQIDESLSQDGYFKFEKRAVDTCVALESAQKAMSNSNCDRKLRAVCRVPKKLICE